MKTTDVRWIELAIPAGFVTCIAYPVLIFAPLPVVVMGILAALIGPFLGIASVGLWRLLRLHRRSVAAELGAISNLLAGTLFSSMLLVQLAVRLRADEAGVARDLVGVWLGLDVAWDVWIGIGTGAFALAMASHPRFGRPFAAVGLVLAAILLVLNLLTFPEPPAESGWFDIGPAIGLWYLAVTIQTWRSLGWARQQVHA